MKEYKSGLSLVIIGNLLYIAYLAFSKNSTSNFGDFSNGLLVGLSIGCNFIGIVLLSYYMSKNNKKKGK